MIFDWSLFPSAYILASLVGSIILAANGTDTPEILVALGSAVVGGLAGLLAPSPLNR